MERRKFFSLVKTKKVYYIDMYIWTIPATENNVLSLRAAKGENGATTTTTMTMTMIITTTAASREHTDSIVGLLIIRWCLTAGQTRIRAWKFMIVYSRTIITFMRSYITWNVFWRRTHNVTWHGLFHRLNDARFIPCGAREGLQGVEIKLLACI